MGGSHRAQMRRCGGFGTMWGAIDLQAFAALFLVFISLVVHLVGKPFDTKPGSSDLVLHKLEFASLTICWCTFWGGLLYFLGGSARDGVGVADWLLILLTICIVAANTVFMLFAVRMYVREYVQDRKIWKERRKTRRMTQMLSTTAVVPIGQSGAENRRLRLGTQARAQEERMPVPG